MRLSVPPKGITVDGLAFPAGEVEVDDPYWSSALQARGAALAELDIPTDAPRSSIPNLEDGAVLSGIGPPGDDVGEPGDSYVDMTTGDVYRRE